MSGDLYDRVRAAINDTAPSDINQPSDPRPIAGWPKRDRSPDAEPVPDPSELADAVVEQRGY